MATTKYIRAMSFWETVSTMYRLYFKIMIPTFLLNSLGIWLSWWILIVGAFVGPVLLMTSNVILGKPLKAWNSFLKGIFSFALLKIAMSSIIYLILMFVIPFFFIIRNPENPSLPFEIFVYLYVIFLPIWIFIPIIMLLEKKGLRASTTRSFQIIRKSFSSTLQMDIFVTAVFTVIAMLFSSILPPPTTTPSLSSFALGLAASFILFLFSGFSSLPYVIVYYEYRARYEGYSEELLAEEMGYQPMEEMMTV